MGAALTDNSALTRSFMEDSDESKENAENTNESKDKPKRSAVVDELVLRMPSSAN